MTVHNSTQADLYRQATPEDVRHVLGDLEDVVVADILSMQPTYRDLSDAAIWARGDGDLIVREHRELSAGARAVAELLTRQDEEVVDEGD